MTSSPGSSGRQAESKDIVDAARKGCRIDAPSIRPDGVEVPALMEILKTLMQSNRMNSYYLFSWRSTAGPLFIIRACGSDNT